MFKTIEPSRILDINSKLYPSRTIREVEFYFDSNKLSEKEIAKTILYNFKELDKLKLTFNMRLNLSKTLAMHEMNDKQKKVYSKLEDSQKLGFISRFIMSRARVVGIPNVYIEQYQDVKYRYKLFKGHENWREHTIHLYNETLKLLKAIMDLTFKDSDNYPVIIKIMNLN